MSASDLLNLDIAALIQNAQALRDDPDAAYGEGTFAEIRLALVGGFTTDFVARILEVFLHAWNIKADIFQTPFGTLTESILAPDSELYGFRPQLTLLLVHQGNLMGAPPPTAQPSELEAAVENEARRWRSYWKTLASRAGTQIIQSNFELPTARALGNMDGFHPSGRGAYTRAVNLGLARDLPKGVSIFDLDYQSAHFGLKHVRDDARYHTTKQPFSFAFLPTYCHALSSVIAAHCGRAKKCVVLDLDDTLWGKTAAEDGIDNIELGPDSALGEAFLAFQRYLKGLRGRGVILAVNSKNDAELAKHVFEAHPHMALTLDDIACFEANWNNKADNLRTIASKINIGRDSMVFFDNSAQERHLIRQTFPEVTVVDVPEEPSDYVAALDQCMAFEVVELTADAAKRTEYLIQNQHRAETEDEFLDYDAYLDSLHMVANVAPIGHKNLPRAAELVQRTNQFNLRTIRHSTAQLERMLSNGKHLGFCCDLRDRFGQHGIISVVILERRPDQLFIDTWLMSCRVLKKSVEQFVFEKIVDVAKSEGVSKIAAEYRPTSKNKMVAELYSQLGFDKTSVSHAGETTWEFSLSDSSAQEKHHIVEE